MAKPGKFSPKGRNEEASAQRKLEWQRRKAGLPAKNPPKSKSKMTPEARKRLAERARQQWADPNSKLRTPARRGTLVLREPPRHAAQLIRTGIAEFGQNVSAICEMLQCSRRTFYDWMERHPEIRAAYEEGRAVMEERLVSKLYQQAMDGYAPAAMFLCKAKFGMRDSGPIPGEENTPESKAAKIREALKAMKQMDGLEAGDAPAKQEQPYD